MSAIFKLYMGNALISTGTIEEIFQEVEMLKKARKGKKNPIYGTFMKIGKKVGNTLMDDLQDDSKKRRKDRRKHEK